MLLAIAILEYNRVIVDVVEGTATTCRALSIALVATVALPTILILFNPILILVPVIVESSLLPGQLLSIIQTTTLLVLLLLDDRYSTGSRCLRLIIRSSFVILTTINLNSNNLTIFVLIINTIVFCRLKTFKLLVQNVVLRGMMWLYTEVTALFPSIYLPCVSLCVSRCVSPCVSLCASMCCIYKMYWPAQARRLLTTR